MRVPIALAFVYLCLFSSEAVGQGACKPAPTGFGPAWAEAYRAWCEGCGGTYDKDGPKCIRGPNWGGGDKSKASTGLPSTGNPLLDLGAWLIIESLKDDPVARARRETEQKAAALLAEQERQRRLVAEAEAQRERDLQFQRLSDLLKGTGGASQGIALKSESDGKALPLKTGSALFGIPGNPAGTATSLQLKTESTPGGTPSLSALIQLNRATYLSRAASQAANREDAAIYAEAAFRAAMGGPVPFELPQSVEGVPVGEAVRLTEVRAQFEGARIAELAAERRLDAAKIAKNEAQEARRLAETNLQKRKADAALTIKAGTKLTDDKVAQAEQLLRDATAWDDRMAQALVESQAESEEAKNSLKAAEERARAYVKSLGRPVGSNPPPP